MFSHLRREAWLYSLCAAQGGVLLVFLNFAGALPLIQADWQLSNAQAGMIQAAGQVGYLLAVLVISSLADYIGPERLILGGTLWAGLANLGLAALAHDTPSAVLFRVLVGVGVAGVYMPGMNVIARRVPAARRGQAVGLFVAAFTLGTAASIALGGGLAAAIGWRAAFAITSLGPLVGAAAAWPGLRTAAPRPAAARDERPRAPISQLLHNRAALLAIGAYTVHVWELFGLRSWLPAFLAASLTLTGSGLAQATRAGASVAGAATLLAAGVTALAATLSDRIGRTKTIFAIMAGSFVATLGLGFTLDKAWPLVVGFALAAAVLANADSAAISTALTETVSEDTLGRTLAIYSFTGFLAGTIAPLAFGAVLDYAADATPWRWAFGALALGPMLGLIVVVGLHRRIGAAASWRADRV